MLKLPGTSLASCTLVLGALLISAACGGAESPASDPPADPPAMAPAETASPTDAAQFGVAECDEYVSKYLACIGQMPNEAQTAARSALDQTRTTWQQIASTDQGRAGLAAACTAAVDAARTATSAYGCTW